jgi:ubiquitin-protein ligase
MTIQRLISGPDIASACNEEAKELYLHNLAEYNNIVKEWTELHA